jgi:hypothetical protein
MSRSCHAGRILAIIVAGLFTVVGVVPTATAATTSVVQKTTPNGSASGIWCC